MSLAGEATRHVPLMIVEDEDDMRFVIRLALARDSRLDVVGEADSAEAAIDMAKGLQPRLVVLDNRLEGELSGLDAAPLIKDVAPATKVLLFSAFDLERAAAAAPAVDAFLGKHAIARLVSTVDDLVDLPHLR